VYELGGGLLGFIIKQIFWVPHRFRYGIILAGAFGNVGDLRKDITHFTLDDTNATSCKIATAVALGVTSSAPFNGTSDQNLSIAYISVIVLVFVVS
jgi:predicted permease